MSASLSPGLFFDRDGVINESPGDGYILTPSAFHLRPGIGEAMKVGMDRGYPLFVVTNQRCVGKGLLTLAGLDEIHQKMLAGLAGYGVSIRHIFAYTGQEKDGFGAKPRPDFILQAAREFGIDLTRSWVFGDQDKDLAMGRSAGVSKVVLIPSDKPTTLVPDVRCEITDLPEFLRQNLPDLVS